MSNQETTHLLSGHNRRKSGSLRLYNAVTSSRYLPGVLLLASCTCLFAVVTYFHHNNNHSTNILLSETTPPDRFIYEHHFGGYGEGGRDRAVIEPPEDTLIFGATSSPAASNPMALDAATKLLQSVGIYAVGATWTPLTLTMLWVSLQDVLNTGATLPATLHLSLYLVPNDVVGDYQVVERKDGFLPTQAILSQATFNRAFVSEAVFDGVKGIVYSNRLKFAVLALVTDMGRDIVNCQTISKAWFDCLFGNSTTPDYTAMTKTTTTEGPGRFTDFLPLERLTTIQWWLMMPDHLHKLPGLNWGFRRSYGLEHPLYMYVPAVSWPDNQDVSYTEFLDITYSRDCDTMRHLYLHEKTHFYYGRVMTNQEKGEWFDLGGWTKDWNQQWAALGTTTQFVSGYAGSVDPNEDLAESSAEYVLHPALLKTRSPQKYNWMKKNMMKGYEYIPSFWPQAKFSVLNGDGSHQSFPNPVQSLQVEVTGKEFDDKKVKITIQLSPGHGWSSPLKAWTDISPPSGWPEASITMNFQQEGDVLTAQTTVPKTEEYGFWRSSQLHVQDALGVTRWIHLDESNWRVYINNKYFGDNALQYFLKSLHVEVDAAKTKDDLPNQFKAGDDGTVPRITVTFEYSGNHQPYFKYPVSARLVRRDASQSYFVEGWGDCPGGWSQQSSIAMCQVKFMLNNFVAGEWYVAQVFMQESTGRSYMEFFTNYVYDEAPTYFVVPGAGADNSPPEINISSFALKAAPVNQTSPNGETVVEFTAQAKDEESGIAKATYRLLDPEGNSHFGNFDALPAVVNNKEWQTLKLLVTLPRGSPPGQWGIEEIEVFDKAGNKADIRMVDTLIFKPIATPAPIPAK